MEKRTVQTAGEELLDSTLAFRVPAERRYRVLAAAARHGEMISDWLRRVTDEALRREGLLPTGDPAEEHRRTALEPPP